MGAWGIGPFENDDAMDWFVDVTGSAANPPSHSAIASAFAAAAGEEYLEVTEGATVIAAAEFVAAARSRPRIDPGLQADVAALLKMARYGDVETLRLDALRALERACDERVSEVAELWEDAVPENLMAWRASIADLRERLG